MTSTYAAKLDSITSGASVSSVGVSGGSTGLTFTGGPITSSGTVTMTGTLSAENGGTGVLPPYSNGQLLIGDGVDNDWKKATLTAGSNITITNGPGSITIAATGAGTGDVVGPTGSTDGTFAIFDGTTGKIIKEASWVQSAGDFIGPVGFTTMPDGFVYIPADAGAPTGTPTNVTGNNVPMYFDTTNEKLYVYSPSHSPSAAWIAIN